MSEVGVHHRWQPSSLLLYRPLITVGALLITEVVSSSIPIRGAPLRLLDNFNNLHNLTTIRSRGAYVRFCGPNGEVRIDFRTPRLDATGLALGYLFHFDTSKTERLEIDSGDPASAPSRVINAEVHIFIRAFHPGMSPSGIIVCPKLEGLCSCCPRGGGPMPEAPIKRCLIKAWSFHFSGPQCGGSWW